jgi:hypothetical protein
MPITHKDLIAIDLDLILAASTLRSAQLIQRDAQRGAWDLDYPIIRLLHLEDHKNRTRKPKCRNEQCCGHAGVARCKSAEAGKDDR